MALIVQKFGGTSVATTDRIKNVAKRVARWKAQGHDIIVVPSAMSGETNRLIGLAKEISAVTGFNLETVLMTQVVGFSTVVFPFQVAPLVVAMQLSGEKLGSLLKLTAPLAAITLIVLLPLDYLWWALLGWF